VLGSEGAARRVVDVASGDASPVGGAVVSAFKRSPSGPIRFGVDFSGMPVPEDSPLAPVRTVWGGMAPDATVRVVYREGDRRTTLAEFSGPDA